MQRYFTAMTFSSDEQETRRIMDCLSEVKARFPDARIYDDPDGDEKRLTLVFNNIPSDRITTVKDGLAQVLRENKVNDTFVTFDQSTDWEQAKKEGTQNVSLMNGYHRKPFDGDIQEARRAAKALTAYEYLHETSELPLLTPFRDTLQSLDTTSRSFEMRTDSLSKKSFNEIEDVLLELERNNATTLPLGFGSTKTQIKRDESGQGAYIACAPMSQSDCLSLQHDIIDILSQNDDNAVFTVSNDGVVDKNGVLSKNGFSPVPDVFFENDAMQKAVQEKKHEMTVSDALKKHSEYERLWHDGKFGPTMSAEAKQASGRPSYGMTDEKLPKNRKIGQIPLWEIRHSPEKAEAVLVTSPEFTKILNRIENVEARKNVVLATTSSNMLHVMQAFKSAQQGKSVAPPTDVPAEYHLLKYQIGDYQFSLSDASNTGRQVAQAVNGQNALIYAEALQGRNATADNNDTVQMNMQ